MYRGQWCLSPLQSRHLETSHSSPNHHQLPCCIFWISLKVWNLFAFEGDFSFGKARSCRAPKTGCSGAESHGWFDVSPKNSAPDVMHEQAHYGDEAANHQLPIAAAFWITQIVSAEECLSLMQNLIALLAQSFWMQWPHSTHAHSMAPLTSTVKSSLLTHVNSCPLSLAARLHQCHTNHSSYINYGWTFSGQTLYSQIYRYICTYAFKCAYKTVWMFEGIK